MRAFLRTVKEIRGTSIYASTYYFVEDSDEGVRVQDQNLLKQIGDALCEDGALKQCKPPEGAIPLFDIVFTVTNTHKKQATYSIGYHKYNGCPQLVIDAQMEAYQHIKSNIRKARKELLADKARCCDGVLEVV